MFSKKSPPLSPHGGGLQIPDELANEAAAAYQAGNYLSALEAYGKAIDKIHTMCVVAAPGSRIRTPGPGDQPILDGFVASMTALSQRGQPINAPLVEQCLNYLGQIAAEAGTESGRYFDACNRIGAPPSAPVPTPPVAAAAPSHRDPPAAPPAQYPAGWYADPAGRFEQRYFDGQQWTGHVATGGQSQFSPL